MSATAETPAPVPAQEPASTAPPPHKPREAYVAKARARVGGVVARICAVGLMLGLLGGLTALADTSSGTSIFDMARDESAAATEVRLPPFGFFIGPVLILLLLPIAKARTPRVFPKRSYLPRVAIATVLWIGGLVALAVEVSSLDSRFTIAAGTYIGGTLIVVGLLATLAMWPFGFETVPFPERGAAVPPAPPVGAPPIAAQPTAAPGPDAPSRPAGWYPDPGGMGQRYWYGDRWAERASLPAQPRPRSHAGRWVALGILGVIAVLAALLYFAAIRPDIEQKNDSKAALGDAQALIDRSYPISRAATRDALRAANDSTIARRVDSRLDRVISLRRRAIRELAPVDPLPLGDDKYSDAADHWTTELRTSIDNARDLQYVLREARRSGTGVYLGVSMGTIRASRDEMIAGDARLKATERRLIEPLR